MKLKIIFFLLFLILSLTIPLKISAEFCCGDVNNPDFSGRDPKKCYEFKDVSCRNPNVSGVSSLKSCSELPADTSPLNKYNDYNYKRKADVNGDGKIDNDDVYNPDCFMPIAVPQEIKITDFGKLFSGAVVILLLVAFVLAFFFLIIGGITWLTSGGDKSGVESARGRIIAAIIGLIIVASTWAIFKLIGNVLGYDILGGFKVPSFF